MENDNSYKKETNVLTNSESWEENRWSKKPRNRLYKILKMLTIAASILVKLRIR